LKLKSTEFKDFAILLSVSLLIILSFSFFFFGIAGVRVALGIVLVTVPFYLILNNFELEEGEKVVFSVLLGLTILPSFAYLLGFLISFRLSMAVIFTILVIASFLIKKFRK